jgi:hypothetical protein
MAPTTEHRGTDRLAAVDRLLAAAGVRLTSRVVDLNLVRLRLSSNVEDFAGFGYFTRFADGGDADYQVDCVELDHVSLDERELAPLVDRSFRGDRFRSGFYLTYYFGEPAYLISAGNRYVVLGRRLERTVWPYFVKHLLTVFAADQDLLHLKAAGFGDRAGGATLLFGRGGAGKTVFLAAACAEGASFLTNTHVLLRGALAYGVPAAMRVRPDACFAPLIRHDGFAEHLTAGEFRADPAALFGSHTDRATVRNLCVVDHRPDRPFGIRRLDSERTFDFLEQFAFPVSAYGLKDDLLAHCGGDLDRYTDVYARMKAHLLALVEGAQRLHVNMDMLDPAMRADVFDALGVPRDVPDMMPG